MEALWKSVKLEIKHQMPSHSFRMWMEPVKFIQCQDNSLVLGCPNLFSKKRIAENYAPLIEKQWAKASGSPCSVALEIYDAEQVETKPSDDERQLSLPNLIPRACFGRFLRRDFTFDQFVVGGNNNFAYSAALSLASQDRCQQNALYLLANTGMGKSHLSQAIGHHILAHFPSERVYYVTAEDFTNEMIQSFRNGSMDQFKAKYRDNCDVLLLEDVHFLSGKHRTQVELAFTLDSLFDADKKIIFTSCYLPGDIPKLDDKLRSRLTCGLISNIDAPDYHTRVKILKRKALLNGYRFPDEVTIYLASELTENVRQLESGMISVVSKASLLNSPIDRGLAESVVRNIAGQKKHITIEAIKKMVCKYFQIKVVDLVSPSRKQVLVRPRQIAIYLSRHYTDHPLQAIGKSFNRYHATALHSINTIEREMKTNSVVQQQIEFFRQKLDSGKF